MNDITIARRAYFSIGRKLRHPNWSEDQNLAAFGKLSRPHGHDCELVAFYRGPQNPPVGMVVNLHEIKPVLAAATDLLDGRMLDRDVPFFQSVRPTAENIVEFLWQNLPSQVDSAQLIRLQLKLTPRLSVEKTSTAMKMTRRYEFAAAHRLCAPHLDDSENLQVYGRCSNPAGHGHNFGLEVTVEGAPDTETGLIMPAAELDAIVDAEIYENFDHRHLNEDCPEFSTLIPTSENFAQVMFNKLSARIDGPARRLAKVGLHETQKNYFEVEA